MILVTGGTGFIGSHTALELLKKGKDILIVDNLSNSKVTTLNNIEKIIKVKPKFVKADIRDREALEDIFKNNKIDCVIHFAGLKAVGESVEIPLKYYENNITGTVNLLEVMAKYNCKKIVFSSSATVYGNNKPPLTEDMPTSATNPYGRTKLFIEHILQDLYKSDNSWNIVILRYFNPVGADKSGLIGELPNGRPNNIMPVISQTAAGIINNMQVFGDDYDTPDGSCIRDYIHITDLANGHIKAIEYLESQGSGIEIFNLGTGHGYSVFELINAFEKASGKKLKYSVGPRRAGDLAEVYANADKAKKILGWNATKNINEMCEDAWRWQSNN